MPIRIYGNPGNYSSWGGGTKVYPVGSVNIIYAASGVNNVILQWSDPQDTTLDAITFAQWAGTIVVRKENEAPKHENDGVVLIDNKTRDKYKDVPFTDTNVESGKTYYYGIFPYTAEGIFNYSADNLARVYVTLIPPVFADASWDIIAYACQNNCVPETWEVGDEKDLTLIGSESQTITMQIWGKNLDTYTDGSGKAPLTIGSKHVLKKRLPFPTDAYRYSETSNSYYLNTTVFNCLPDEVKNNIREVNKWEAGTLSNMGDAILRIFAPSATELNIPKTSYYGNNWGTDNGFVYPIFTNDNSRLKTAYGESNGSVYQTRTRDSSTMSQYNRFIIINYNGAVETTGTNQNVRIPMAFCF